MSTLSIHQKALQAGVWTAIVATGSSAAPMPKIRISHHGREVSEVAVLETSVPGEWQIVFTMSAAYITEGIQTFVIEDADTGDTLESFTMIAGADLSDDIRAEVDLLRAELDMLKRAFRRHCVETQTS